MTPPRNPDATRDRLLESAFNEVHQTGFRAASLDAILARAGVTKGALYHHFPNKQALGYALVDEVIAPYLHERWVVPLESADDPLTVLMESARGFLPVVNERPARLGCPLNNLVQEMSGVDDEFRLRLENATQHWVDGVARALARGQKNGTVREDIDTQATAYFIVTVIEGGAGMMKLFSDPKQMNGAVHALIDYLNTLRPPAQEA